ncbi:MipA/OmpV family protein [Permianibacter sp. IMCC34836]|uniref:MipA/OmpV family protein n=1 Tax=Permianibacter fluminis TaxID=2738515 RepID=UPI00155661F7|nr:MipA/OmpV family protein [Permianibacter fluminis]NQD35698.1 MipA/OmpV family protein [Permianibacter fluminis]
MWWRTSVLGRARLLCCAGAIVLGTSVLANDGLDPDTLNKTDVDITDVDKTGIDKTDVEKNSADKNGFNSDPLDNDSAASAADASAGCPAEEALADACISVGEWQFGLAVGRGFAENPLFGGRDVRFPLLPRVRYYGERFFLETQTLGYTVTDEPSWRLNFIAYPNLDYAYFHDGNWATGGLTPPTVLPIAVVGDWDPNGNTLPPPVHELNKRRLTWLGGIEASWFHEAWAVQLRAGRDISVGHDGRQIDLSIKRHDEWAGTSIDSAIGWLYRDQKLSDYYFGLDADESGHWLFTYTPAASTSPYLLLTVHHPLTEQLGLLAWLGGQRASDEIANSPLMTQRWFTASFFGVTYDF